MLWVIFPAFSAFFHCIASLMQKRLVGDPSLKRRQCSLIFPHFISYIATVALLVAVFGQAVFMLPVKTAFGLILAGAINVLGAALHLKALSLGDAMDVTIFSQTGPVFSLVLGVLFLNQVIGGNQLVGFLIILAAALLVAVKGNGESQHRKLNIKLVIMTIAYAFFSILSDVIYLYSIKGETSNLTLFAQSFLFFQIGSFIATIFCSILSDSWRRALFSAFVKGKRKKQNLAAAFVECLGFFFAEILYKLGLIFAPVIALFSVVIKASSLFASLILNVVLGALFPKQVKVKKFTRQSFAIYLFAVAMIIVGVYVMN